MKYTQEQIIELAKEVEANDGIEWGNLPLDRDKIYQVVGSQAYELFDKFSTTDDSELMIESRMSSMSRTLSMSRLAFRRSMTEFCSSDFLIVTA